MLGRARSRSLDAVGLIVETDSRFPDPQGARILIEEGIEPIAGIEVDTDPLVEQAEEIIDRCEHLARRMREAEAHESSQASELGMYQ